MCLYVYMVKTSVLKWEKYKRKICENYYIMTDLSENWFVFIDNFLKVMYKIIMFIILF